jgi:small nuclear ribonucleoprotein (snRNP)-like protein
VEDCPPMRWERLFADLEAQLAAAAEREWAGEIADRSRYELGQLGLADRLCAHLNAEVAVQLTSNEHVTGGLRDCGPDWLLIAESGGRETLVPLEAVGAVAGLSRRAATPGSDGVVGTRLDLRRALRALVRDRAPVSLRLHGGITLAGTLDAVGADHIDLAEHFPAELRRPGTVRQVRVVPLRAVVLVRAG